MYVKNSLRQKAIAHIATLHPLNKNINYTKEPLVEIYGDLVFDTKTMQKYLPKTIFSTLQETINEGRPLAAEIADEVADVMKDWALSKGATHYSHWFQPMTGLAAEKHDAFLTLACDGSVINQFSGKTLIKGESDASSFPSGGIRTTFEARGYTAWDPRSPVFIKESLNGATLCIPTAFYSYTGESLDRKTPLLRSTQALSHHALRLLKLFGNETAQYVNTALGIEQEYFLIDRQLFLQRPDLVNAGRTLYGARPPKGQEMGDHYFGTIKSRILAFMMDVEKRLYRLGVPLKTRHNETAPAQFELAPLYEEANIATDHNMLIMETLRSVAREHGFECLLHEKPFKGVNGSGKHCNWSLMDSDHINLFDPGETPHENAQFLVFLCSMVRAVHEYAPLIRIATATAGNDHRLGSHEAPPAILSVFLGNQLANVVESIIAGKQSKGKQAEFMRVGVSALPPLPRDATDRNRTSPVAFTGNKFEFRAVGSSQSPSPLTFLVNAAITETFDIYATTLEKEVATGVPFLDAVNALLKKEFALHAPVIFGGDAYSPAWLKESKTRKLPNLNNSVDAIANFNNKQYVELLDQYKILSEREIHARKDILLDEFSNSLLIEAQITLEMGRTMVLPSALAAQTKMANTILTIDKVADASLTETHHVLFNRISRHVRDLMIALDRLDEELPRCMDIKGSALQKAQFSNNLLLPIMTACRAEGDALESLIDDGLWPLPKYRELLWLC